MSSEAQHLTPAQEAAKLGEQIKADADHYGCYYEGLDQQVDRLVALVPAQVAPTQSLAQEREGQAEFMTLTGRAFAAARSGAQQCGRTGRLFDARCEGDGSQALGQLVAN
jgi:hypothetical protein